MARIAFISLGCPKNQVDGDRMCHALLSAGHTTVGDPAQADLILVNTCAFIESAKQEAIDTILQAASVVNDRGVRPKLVVTGCLSERYRQQLRLQIPEIDASVGIGSDAGIAQLVGRVLAGESVEAYGAKTDLPLEGSRVISTPRHFAYLKVAEGCSNCCSYCAIPQIRGPLRSRSVGSSVREAEWLASEGVRELILVAQDITAYGDDTGTNRCAELLDALEEVRGIRWIRLLYAYPERVTDAFIDAMKRNKKVLPYLDLPIQHISDGMLRAMNRHGDSASVRSAVRRLRERIPGIALRTTLLTGFPGETEEQFAELCDFVREARFDRLGCFAYSQEEGTAAAKMKQIPVRVRRKRAEEIMRIQADIMQQAQAEKVGKTLTVLCDGFDPETGKYLCRSETDAPEIDATVYVTSDSVPLKTGGFYRVRIDGSDVYDLYGTPEGEDPLESAE